MQCPKCHSRRYYQRPSRGRYCRDCHATRENRRHHQKRTMFARYGISPMQYDMLLEKQHDACAICHAIRADSGRKRRFCIDHDHATGKVRGLLCNRCNRVLGMVSDSRKLLLALDSYLNEHTIFPGSHKESE